MRTRSPEHSTGSLNHDAPAELRHRPLPPPPDATAQDVHVFLTNFLLALNYDMNREEAEVRAKKMKLDGAALYKTSEEEFKERLDLEGVFIYEALYRSTYGYVRISFVSDSLYSLY